MAVVIIATVMIPIITATTQTTTTTEIDNEGAGWLKLGYSSGNDFDFEITNDNSNIIIGDQTGTMGDNIFYADSKNVIFADFDKNAIFLLDTESSSIHKFSNTVSVENTEGTLNIFDGTETVVSSESPTWAYIPDTNGVYGFFADGGLNLEEGKPTVAVGSYAGVFTYNDTVVAPENANLGLTMSGDYAEGEVIWEHTAPADTQNEPNMVRSLNPSGSKTDDSGLWTFQVFSNGSRLYTYLGQDSTNITVPSQVVSNGVTYTINMFGNATTRGNVLTNDNLSADGCTLKLEEGIQYINGSVCSGATNLKGTLVLPESLLGFYGTGAFTSCGFDSLIVKGNTEFTGATYFSSTSIKEVLNLGTTEITTTSYGLNADSVQDHISALGYIAPVEIRETIIVEDTSLSATLLKLLPVFMVLAVVIFIGYAMYRPDSEFVQSLKNKL
jgi:hypothetical protein